MIGKAFRLVPAEFAALRPRLLAAIVIQALCQAVAYVLLVPVLQAVFEGDLGRAWGWTGLLAIAVALMGAFSYLQASIGLRAGIGMQLSLQTRLGDKLNALPLGWFDTHNAAPLTRLVVENVREIQQVVAYFTAKLLTAVLVPAGVAIGMLFVDWRVSVTMLLAGAGLAAINRLGDRAYRRADAQVHAAAAEADTRVVEFAQAQPVLRAFGAVGAGNRALDAALHRQKSATVRSVYTAVPGLIGFAVSVQGVFLLLVYVIVGRATAGALSAATAIALIAVAARFIEPLNQAAQLRGALRSAAAAVERAVALLAEPVLPEATAPVTPGAPEIRFDDVTFGYHPDRPVVSGVGFTVPAGSTTAIVGPSGAGKTTLLRLIARYHDVDSGTVTVGGHDVRAQPSATLLDQLSLVFQNVYLFDRTITENIRIGDPDATDERVRAAAESVRVDEIADRLPDGYDTVVGEGGATLSGGERQRVSIARGLLKDAPVVLLDEATSALDPHNEAVVVRGVDDLTRGRTVVAVTHRLTTIAHADQILFMDGGRIVEHGTHRELLDRGGRYAAFWTERTNSAGWRLEGAASPA